MQNALINQLKNLNINDKEAETYLAILKQKTATVIQLSKMTGIKRTSVYHCLDALIEKGLVDIINEEGKKYYFAENPSERFDRLIEEKRNIVNSITPELKNIYGKGIDHPEIKMYHTIAGLREITNDIFNSKEKVIRYYISGFDIDELLGVDFVDALIKKRIQKGIKSLALRSFEYKPERERGVTHAKQLREVKFIPKEIIIKPYMCIYDNKVVVVSSNEEKFGFIVESQEFAEAQKAIFDAIWNNFAI